MKRSLSFDVCLCAVVGANEAGGSQWPWLSKAPTVWLILKHTDVHRAPALLLKYFFKLLASHLGA
jgi:hypothetical protein